MRTSVRGKRKIENGLWSTLTRTDHNSVMNSFIRIARRAVFWKRDMSVGESFSEFFWRFLGSWTPFKRGVLVHKQFTCFLSTVSSQRRATRIETSLVIVTVVLLRVDACCFLSTVLKLDWCCAICISQSLIWRRVGCFDTFFITAWCKPCFRNHLSIGVTTNVVVVVVSYYFNSTPEPRKGAAKSL